MRQPTPYGKAEDLALQNERLTQTLGNTRRTLERLRSNLKAGVASDGFHTHQELYEARMLYHAHAVSNWEAAGIPVVKSVRHSNGELCFGGGWFIVVAELPGGQISQHYRMADWDLFDCYAVDIPPEFDGHTTQDTHQRLRDALGIEEA